MRRRDQRRAAVFAVYQHDVTGNPVEDLLDAGASSFTLGLSTIVSAEAEQLDIVIDRHAVGWDVSRIAPLDRSILRVAIAEILEPERFDAESPIPAEGAIDEAVETAKQFCSADAPGFINGILGAVIDEKRSAG